MKTLFLLLLSAITLQSAIKFDGGGAGTSYINFGSGAALDNVPACTISAWVFLHGTNGATSSPRIVDKVSTGWLYLIAIGPSGNTAGTNCLLFQVGFATTGLAVSTGVDTFKTGILHHIAITWTGSTSTTGVKFYINGVEETSRFLNQSGAGSRTSDASGNLLLGNDPSGIRGLNGSAAEVAIWTNVLTASQIATLATPRMTQMPLMFPAGLVSYWPMDHGPDGGAVIAATSSIRDRSNGGNHGTPSGSSTWKSLPIPYP